MTRLSAAQRRALRIIVESGDTGTAGRAASIDADTLRCLWQRDLITYTRRTRSILIRDATWFATPAGIAADKEQT